MESAARTPSPNPPLFEAKDLTKAFGSQARTPRRLVLDVLISSHLLHEVEQICDRVLFIRDGRLQPEAVFDRGRSACIEGAFVRTGDDVRAAQVLASEDYVDEVLADSDGLLCRVAAIDVPRVAKALHHAGLELLELTPRRPSLEEIYIEHYGTDQVLS
jgi:ABC-2 type transport system ATP-binding protein